MKNPGLSWLLRRTKFREKSPYAYDELFGYANVNRDSLLTYHGRDANSASTAHLVESTDADGSNIIVMIIEEFHRISKSKSATN